MTRGLAATAFLLVLTFGVPAATGAATTQAADPAVAALVAQLDADDWQVRDAAVAKLVAKGDAVRPAMADAAAHAASPEVRSRAAGVIAKLNQIAAERPTRVTLHMANANPRAVFGELSKQAGLPLPLWPEQLWTPQFPGQVKTISVDADAKPFWDVMADVCGAAGVYPHTMGGNEADFTLMQGGAANLSGPRSAVDPQFTVVALSAGRMRQVGYTTNAFAGGSDNMQFCLFADPKVRVLSAAMTATLTEARDEHGRSIAVPPQPGAQQQMNPFAHGHVFEFNTTLALPAGGYTRASVLRGQIRVVVPTRVEHLVIEDVGHHVGASASAGGCAVRVQSCTVDEHNLSYQLALTTPAAKNMRQQQSQSLSAGLRLVDAAGHTVCAGVGCYESDGVLVCQNNYGTSDVIRQPLRLIWDAPAGVRDVDVPFAFHDLPLPTP